MTLQLREHFRAQPSSAFHDLGDRQFGVVVENRLRHTAEEIECRHMAIAKGYRRFGWIRLDETAIRVRRSMQK
jgi:hypothetical protein